MKKLSHGEEEELCFQINLYKYALRHCIKIIQFSCDQRVH